MGVPGALEVLGKMCYVDIQVNKQKVVSKTSLTWPNDLRIYRDRVTTRINSCSFVGLLEAVELKHPFIKNSARPTSSLYKAASE